MYRTMDLNMVQVTHMALLFSTRAKKGTRFRETDIVHVKSLQQNGRVPYPIVTVSIQCI